jgi:hypothetical protein
MMQETTHPAFDIEAQSTPQNGSWWQPDAFGVISHCEHGGPELVLDGELVSREMDEAWQAIPEKRLDEFRELVAQADALAHKFAEFGHLLRLQSESTKQFAADAWESVLVYSPATMLLRLRWRREDGTQPKRPLPPPDARITGIPFDDRDQPPGHFPGANGKPWGVGQPLNLKTTSLGASDYRYSPPRQGGPSTSSDPSSRV